VDTMLIFLTSLATAFLCARVADGGRITLTDLVFGVFGGVAGLSLMQVLAADGAEVGRALPLLLTCALTLGLESLRRQPVRW
jgi:hypothetical protein